MSLPQPPPTPPARPAPPAGSSDEYWVHWRYDEAEWRAWVAADLKRAYDDLLVQRVALGSLIALLAVLLSMIALPAANTTAISVNLLCLGAVWLIAVTLTVLLVVDTVRK